MQSLELICIEIERTIYTENEAGEEKNKINGIQLPGCNHYHHLKKHSFQCAAIKSLERQVILIYQLKYVFKRNCMRKTQMPTFIIQQHVDSTGACHKIKPKIAFFFSY